MGKPFAYFYRQESDDKFKLLIYVIALLLITVAIATDSSRDFSQENNDALTSNSIRDIILMRCGRQICLIGQSCIDGRTCEVLPLCDSPDCLKGSKCTDNFNLYVKFC